MICTLTIGGFTLDLAGGQGFPSETSGLTIDNQPVFQQTAYIGAIEGRQFARPGAMTSVSFQSNLTFPSKEEADFYLLTLPGDLKDQRGATAKLGVETAAGTKQVETATVATAPTGAGNATITVTAANVTGTPVSLSVPLLGTETTTETAMKIADAINANTGIRKRFTASTPTNPSMVVTGSLTPDLTGTYAYSGEESGKASYTLSPLIRIYWTTGTSKWTISNLLSIADRWESADPVATPDLVTTWTAVGAATGTPVVKPLAQTVLTAKQEAANDSTLNIAIANGSPSPGLTTAATSANTTPGVAPTLSYLLNLYDVSARVTSSYMGATVRLSVNLTGRITAP